MKHTRRSLIFTFFLVGIAAFLIGLNLGKRIERANVTYVPPATTEPTPTDSTVLDNADNAEARDIVTYSRFTFEDCGVLFVVPSVLERVETPENEAEFTDVELTNVELTSVDAAGSETAEAGKIFVTCNQEFIADQQERLESLEEVGSVEIVSQTVTVYSEGGSSDSEGGLSGGSNVWILRNADRDRVLFEVSEGLAPLIQETLEML